MAGYEESWSSHKPKSPYGMVNGLRPTLSTVYNSTKEFHRLESKNDDEKQPKDALKDGIQHSYIVCV